MLADVVGGLGFRADLLGQADSIQVDEESAVEALVQLDAGSHVAWPLPAGRDVDEVWPESDGIVVLDHSAVLEAEALLEAAVLRPGRPGWFGVLWGDSEAPVVAGEMPRQELVGIHQVGDLSQP